MNIPWNSSISIHMPEILKPYFFARASQRICPTTLFFFAIHIPTSPNCNDHGGQISHETLLSPVSQKFLSHSHPFINPNKSPIKMTMAQVLPWHHLGADFARGPAAPPTSPRAPGQTCRPRSRASSMRLTKNRDFLMIYNIIYMWIYHHLVGKHWLT